MTFISRKLSAVLMLAALLAVSLSLVSSAGAASSVSQLRARLNELNDEFTKAGREYDKAFWELDETEAGIEKTNAEIEANLGELQVLREQLGERVDAWYRSDDLGMLGFLLGSDSFDEFVTRMDLVRRVASSDAGVIEHTRAVIVELEAQRETLEAQQADQAKQVAAFKKKRDGLQKRLRDTKAEYERVQSQLAKAAAANSSSRASTRRIAVAGPNGMVFPVAGPNYYSDTWGASRGGGRRRHKGTDIMAAEGTPVVATLSGSVTARNGSTSGLYVALTADNGWVFYYMHLSSIAVRSGRVQAGQIIGYVGHTGNATASAPHLHYEIHPGGGAAVNPYPYLRQMQGR